MPADVFGERKKPGNGDLNDHERLVLKEKSKKSYGSVVDVPDDNSDHLIEKIPQYAVKYGLFAYSETFDYVLMFIGTVASVIHGAGFPMLSIFLGGMTTIFLRAQNSEWVLGKPPNNTDVPPISRDEFNQGVATYSIYYLILGIAMFVTSYAQIACWECVAERLVHKLRNNYLLSTLRQEIAWFDTKQTGNLTSRLTDDLERVREGLGDKLSLFIQMISAFLAGFIVGFIYNWQMSVVMLCFTPFLAYTNAWMAKMMAQRTKIEQTKYAVAGAIAEESFSSMRTIHSLNAQNQEINRYEVALEDGRKTGLIKYMYMGLGYGAAHITMYVSYAVAFFFGSRLVIWDPSFDRGSVFTVFFAVMTGSTALGGALPHLTSISMATGAGRTVLSVINNDPDIDPYSQDGIIPSRIKGSIEVNNLHFRYPLRKDVKILNGISFKAKPGEKIALVGSSGCGKSTIINLLLRFYDPESGFIKIDGHDLRDLNVKALRDAIGIVSQEPILFDGTLEENVLLGNEFGSREDVIKCLKMANAYDFITKLPDGLYTRVGERGVQLSGGQKQRIAIARALIKNPKILLLDEATSALDTESERIVQEALDKAQEGRTTIIVAHRLATIRDVDQIHVFQNGEIVESGTHQQLMDSRGVFYSMVEAQQIQTVEDETMTRIQEEDQLEENEEDIIQLGESASLTGSTAQKSSIIHKKSIVGGMRNRRKITEPSIISAISDAQDIKEMQEEIEQNAVKPTPMSKIFKMNKGNFHYLIFGMLGCCTSGLVTPIFALIYSQIFQVFGEPVDQMASDAIFWSFMFVVLGLMASGGFFVSANFLGRCGEALTKKLRLEAFTNLLRQDIGFYDDERHNTGKLCTRFATDAPNVRYVFTRLPVVVSSVVTLIGSIVIGFIYGWQLALILLAIIPLILASGYFEMQMKFGKAMRDTESLEDAGKIASEAVENIRTVQGLNKQLIFHEKYIHHLQEPFRQNMKQAHIYGGVFAFSQSVMFFMYAISFYLGSIFVNEGSMDPLAVYRVFFAMAFCGQSVGQISSFIPDVVKSRLAASLLFHLIEYPTLIDNLSNWGLQSTLQGNIKLNGVHFAYPTRSRLRVLNGLDLEVKAGQTVALVGFSGCGKSTIMALLERFYNPLKGQIMIDGMNIRDLNIHSLREQLCIVSQEPILFDCTIEQNIVYGLDRVVDHDEVVSAAEQANIHKFILGLPEGYQTRVGEKGTQLSGGQKQRIAIARTLARDPKVLLLDEATSALDAQSESIVQSALDNAAKGRSTIMIAHRLSTIRNADKIVVFEKGEIAEQGTHAELVAMGGRYAALVKAQQFIPDDESDVEEEIDLGDPPRETKIATYDFPPDSGPIRTYKFDDVSRKSSIESTQFGRQAFVRGASINDSISRASGSTSVMGTSGVDAYGRTPDEIQKFMADVNETMNEDDKDNYNILTVYKNAKGQYLMILLGIFCAMLQGLQLPAISLAFTYVFQSFEFVQTDPGKMMNRCVRALGIFLGIGAGTWLALFFASVFFGYASENLTMRFRVAAFRNILYQDAGYFDNPAHTAGKLITRLASDAPNVKAVVDSRLLQVIQGITAVLVSIIIAFIYSWQIALLGILYLTYLIFATIFLAYKVMATNMMLAKTDEAGRIAIEIIENVKTIQLLTREAYFNNHYSKAAKNQKKAEMKKCLYEATNNAVTQTNQFFMCAICYALGIAIIYKGQKSASDVFQAITAMLLAAVAVMNSSSYFPEFVKANSSARLLFSMIFRKPKTGDSSVGEKPEIRGNILFEKVKFTYPQKPNQPVMVDLNFTALRGQTIALVGPSGCGKSTTISMLERFYDVTGGALRIDGKDIRTLCLDHLRTQMALVGQEPRLFAGTIRENVMFGLKGQVTDEQINNALDLANARRFINNLPSGIETEVGEKGTQMSGGQKQRIAIARALIRDPKILLLDEATSALDSESERAVQEALDRAREGRTCITIAHRLSSIQNSDVILYIEGGRVQEAGNHQALMQKKGKYYDLIRKQDLAT